MQSLNLTNIMTTDVTTVSKNTLVSSVLRLMKTNRISSVVMTDDHKPLGIFTERDAVLLMQNKSDLNTLTIEETTQKSLICVDEEMGYLEAYHLLSDKKVRHLVVTDSLGKLSGIISESDFLKNIGAEFLVQFKEVGTLMTSVISTLGPNQTVTDAIHIMASSKVSSVIIQENGVPIGVYTERDVVRLDGDYEQQHTTQLRQVMSSPVTTILVTTLVSDAIRLMDEQHIRRLVVVDHEQKLVGLLTRHDVVQSLRGSQIEFLQQRLQKKNNDVDTLKRELEAEKRSNQLQTLLNESQRMAKIGSWESRLLSNEILWSPETFRILECDPATTVPSYELFFSLTHPDDLEQVVQAFEESIDQGTTYTITHRLLLKSGKIKFVKEHGETTYDEDGLPVKSIGTIQDVTHQKLAEIELQKTTRELNRAQKIARVGSWTLDVESGIMTWSDEMFQIFSRPKTSQLKYSTLFKWLHPEDRQLHSIYIQQLLQLKPGDRSAPIECRLVLPSGEIRRAKILVEAEYSTKGLLTQFFGTLLDITEQHAKELRLQQYASIFSHLAEGILITDPEFRILDVNPAFTTITGYSKEDVLGQTPKLLQSGLHRPDFYHKLWKVVHKTGQWQGEITNRRKDGVLYPQWLAMSNIKDAQGEVLNYIAVFTDISSIKKTEDELRFLAHHDALTKLPNRLLLEDRLTHSLERSTRSNIKTAILFIDLDRFKEVNDSFGHPVGDELLKIVAKRLKKICRKQDTVARVSGDEFVLVLEDIRSVQDVVLVAQKILDQLSRPMSIEQHHFRITTSIGIAMSPDDGTCSVDLLKKADTALYRVKDQGRNNFEFFSEEMATANFELMYLNTALRKALEQDEFVLHYQPQTNVLTGKIIGTEALVRWQSPEMGLVPPNRFIPLTEDTGLIIPLGEWILNQACHQMKEWLLQGADVEHIAVNISGRQLSHKNIVPAVKNALLNSQLEPRFLELEITESTLMGEERYITVLNELKALGIRLSIDDFGTGYSSLSRLKHMPIDKLKIDQSFIKDLPRNPDDVTITRTIIGLAKNFNLEVVAEGVETEEQLAFLKENDCIHIQGYLFGRPVPASEVVFKQNTQRILK